VVYDTIYILEAKKREVGKKVLLEYGDRKLIPGGRLEAVIKSMRLTVENGIGYLRAVHCGMANADTNGDELNCYWVEEP
jgi:hypothetical protein